MNVNHPIQNLKVNSVNPLSPQQISIIDYENLLDYSNTDFFNLMRNILNIFKDKKEREQETNSCKRIINTQEMLNNPYPDNESSLKYSTAWRKTFDAIEEVRRIHKFIPDLFLTIFNNIILEFLEIAATSNTIISRACLRLIGEIYKYSGDSDNIGYWIKKTVPCALSKCECENRVLREEAANIMQTLVNHLFIPETIETLLDNSNNKNPSISQASFYFLMMFLNNFDDFTLFNNFEAIDWNDVVTSLAGMYNMKKEAYLKKAFAFLDFLEESFSKLYNYNYLETVFSEINDKKVCSDFEKLLEERRTFQNLNKNKFDNKQKLYSNRKSIRSDKRKSLGNKNSLKTIYNFENNDLYNNNLEIEIRFKENAERIYPNSSQAQVKCLGRDF